MRRFHCCILIRAAEQHLSHLSPQTLGGLGPPHPSYPSVSIQLICDSTLQLNEPNELALSYEAVRLAPCRGEGRGRLREDDRGRRRAVRMWLINRMHCGVMRACRVCDTKTGPTQQVREASSVRLCIIIIPCMEVRSLLGQTLFCSLF